MATLALILLFVLVSGTPLTTSYQNTACICGVRHTLLVLADFPEYPHLSSRAEIANLFFNRVARYFYDVSYGKLRVTGNSTDWIMLPKLYSQYFGTGLRTSDLVNVAQDAFSSASQSFNITGFDVVVLVLSFYPSQTGDFVSYEQGISTKSVLVARFVVVDENSDWSAYAHAFALLLGLWRVQAQLSNMGVYDLAAGGDGDMSVWSKVKLGWVNDSQILSEEASGPRRVVTLDPVEDPGSDALALRIGLGTAAGEYWVEVRQPIGYDRNNLPDYGAQVSFVRSDNASTLLEKTLQPDVLSRAVFVDPNYDLSIVVLNATQGRYRLLLGNEQDGRDAETALYAISRAQNAIQSAQTENRFERLDLAQQLLANAQLLFGLAKFHDSSALALSAETTASTATVPPAFQHAVQLLMAAEALKNTTESVGPSQSFPVVQEANAQLDIAKHAFEVRDFVLTEQAAQSAIDLYNRAKQTELLDSILNAVSNLVLVVPILILAFALRSQLKNK
jgi:M6 family metalloprotease-like protein